MLISHDVPMASKLKRDINTLISATRHLEGSFGKSLALDLDPGKRIFDFVQVRSREQDIDGTKVFLEAMLFRGAGDRYDPGRLGKQPGKRNLSRGRALPLTDRLDQIDQREVRLARFRREARHVVAEIGRIELRVLVDLAGQEASAERAERARSRY